MDDITTQFTIHNSDQKKLFRLANKRGDHLSSALIDGLYWHLLGQISRPVLWIGIFLLLIATVYIPTRVFFIRVENPTTVPTKMILEAASENGIRFGACRKNLRNETIKTGILKAIPELEWVGINTAGCTAVITVKEKTILHSENTSGIVHIVAEKEGIIHSVTVTQGTARIKPGQFVHEGALLISGYSDCGQVIMGTQAQGRVAAYTQYPIRGVTPDSRDTIVPTGDIRHRYSLLLGKKRINLWKDSGICLHDCGRIYEEYYLMLPGGFLLPAAICAETYIAYIKIPEPVSEAERILLPAVQSCLLDRMQEGYILDQTSSVVNNSGLWVLEGVFSCKESIGTPQTEQIGENHGKNN